jgi:hypothetical protein
MNVNEAINLVQNAVKHTGSIDQKHIDLTVIPVEQRGEYAKALACLQMAVKNGQLTKDELNHRLRLDY